MLLLCASRYALELELPVTSSKQELQAAFQAAADAGAQRLRGALGLLGGQLATDDCQLADLAGSTSSSAHDKGLGRRRNVRLHAPAKVG